MKASSASRFSWAATPPPAGPLSAAPGTPIGFKWGCLQQEFNRGGAAMRLLLRYTQSLMTQMTQTAVCNRHHSVEQQLCRALLLSLDRMAGNSLTMTQELIARILGVRREGVTEAAGKLQRAGLIRYSRGHIDVLDRGGLESAVCECYGVVRREYSRLMSDIPREPVPPPEPGP